MNRVWTACLIVQLALFQRQRCSILLC